MASIIVNLGNIDNTEVLGNSDYIITGGDGNNTVTLGSGNDQLTLGTGNNTLTMNGGTDQVTAESGNNSITTTGPGGDTINLTSGNNTIVVGDGPDVITAGDGLNTVSAGNGNDTITLGNGFDTVTTLDGNSQIIAGNGAADTITVGTGANSITLGTGSADVVSTGAGGNTVTLSAASASDDTIQGGLTNNDGTGNTLVLTTAGAINAGGVSGFQTYQLAGGGLNTLTLTNANFARLPGATITVEGGDTGSTINASGLSAANAVIIYASPGVNTITGGAANNLFYGETSGASTINGGVGGINTMVFAGPASGYTVTTSGLVTTVVGLNTLDTLTNIQNIRFAPAAPTNLTLTALSDSGVSHTDDITNVTLPTVTGAGVDGDTVTLFNGGAIIGTAIVTGGLWSIDATAPLTVGRNVLTATQADTFGDSSVASAVLNVTLETTAPPPAALTLTPASDSGTSHTDDITNVLLPVITGTGINGDAITLFDGTTAIGSGTVAAGVWSITANVPLDAGNNAITATQTDLAGNVSAPSATLNVTLTPTAPDVTAALVANSLDTQETGILFNQTVSGGGDPNATVTITGGGGAAITTQADASGAWTFDPSTLAQGAHTLVATETDTAGNTASTFPLTSPNLMFHATDETTSTTGSVAGSAYTGPVSYLQAQYDYTGSDNVVITANVANVFIHGGSGEEAFGALAGSNVLEGGSGSNWLVGATGADGGNDTFFVDNRGGQSTWDTLVNFHAGDSLTIWGYDASAGNTSWLSDQGASAYKGSTLEAHLGNGTAASALVTFAGLSSSAQFSSSTGTSGGIEYLSVTRTA